MRVTTIEADGTTTVSEVDVEPLVPSDPLEAFSAVLREAIPTATTLTKMRTALTDALNALDAAR